jgi:hypothetical protein
MIPNLTWHAFLLLVLPGLALALVLVQASSTDQTCSADDGSCSNSEKECTHLHPQCQNFARYGECIYNPRWMQDNCRKACQLCFEPQGECHDLHADCPSWASYMECQANPGYMMRACPVSCWQCINVADLKEQGLSQEEIDHRQRFVQTDFGLWQAIPEPDLDDQVKKMIFQMEYYMRNLTNIGPGTLCNNVYHECMQRVAQGQCQDNLTVMLGHCSLACRMCDHIDLFQKCRRKKSTTKAAVATDLKTIFRNLKNQGATNIVDSKDIENYSEDEWVFSMDQTVWLSDMEIETPKMLESIKHLEWKEASATIYADNSLDIKAPDRTGETTLCGVTCSKVHLPVAALRESIATLLKIPPTHLQTLEFFHYQKGQRFATHHDFQLHDRWKQSGTRVLTVYIVLQAPTKGGGMGFPELDWMLVYQPKVLIWPNVQSKDLLQPLERLKSEQLPVVEGDLYGVYAVVRQYPYDEDEPCA